MWLDFHSPLTPFFFFFSEGVLGSGTVCAGRRWGYPRWFPLLKLSSFFFLLKKLHCLSQTVDAAELFKRTTQQDQQCEFRSNQARKRYLGRGEKNSVSDPFGTLTCNLMQGKVYSQWPLLLPLLLDPSCEGCPSQICPRHFLSDTCLCFLS